MNIINVTNENLEQEHICCAISNNKNEILSDKKFGKMLEEKGL